MTSLLDITKEFAKLKAAFTCKVCRIILTRPVNLGTCKHTVCEDCLCIKTLKCPICKNPYNERDVEDETFVEHVVAGIRKIEGLFTIRTDDVTTRNNPRRIDSIVDGFRIVTADTILKRNPKGETPLHLACKKGTGRNVEELLEKVVDVNATDYANWTALHEAVECGSYECAELLLRNGALADVPGEFYVTPLHKAVSLNNVKIAKLLLTYGADSNAIDYAGKNSHDMCTSKQMAEVLQNTAKDESFVPNIYLNPHVSIFIPSKKGTEKLSKTKVKLITAKEFIQKSETTHLIIERATELDVKILMAVLKGVFVVEENWIDYYLKNENQVSFGFVPDAYHAAVCQAVRNRWLKLPKLFDGINFHVIDHESAVKINGVSLTRQDLIDLIQAGGGKHIIRPPALRTVEDYCCFPYHADRKSELVTCCNYIIYDEAKAPELLYNMKELKHKTSKWLLDCISSFNIGD